MNEQVDVRRDEIGKPDLPSFSRNPSSRITLGNGKLTLDQIIQVSVRGTPVSLNSDPQINLKISDCHQFVGQVVADRKVAYGINTNFGGLANEVLPAAEVELLQENLIWGLKCSLGNKLPTEHIRSAMLIRAQMLTRGISGARIELIERLVKFINSGATPVVRDLGSIGASGDLVPLAQIAGCIIGLSPSFKVDYQGEELASTVVLSRLGLSPLKLKAKEGLALINGTSMMTGTAVHCVYQSQFLMNLSLHIHALFAQALQASHEPFEAFIHQNKPHPGQVFVASAMRELLKDSSFMKTVDHAGNDEKKSVLLQDRYSVRCLPQYLGPIFDGLRTIKGQVEIEANSVDDNPLIDVENERLIHSGNFLGQYIGIGMDQLRYYTGLVAKHIDTQIALVVTPEFSAGLPGSLAGDHDSKVKFGLKGLQICGNSILPKLLHLGNPIVPFFPTHAEQFNQNINSQGFNSANLAWESVNLFRTYLAISLVFAVQAIDLRAWAKSGKYDGRKYLSPALIPLYETIHKISGTEISADKPMIFKNSEHSFDEFVSRIVTDLSAIDGNIASVMSKSFSSLGY
jgi:phenylalanine ammonia-lyase